MSPKKDDYMRGYADGFKDALARTKSALEFYANPDVYKPHPHGIGFDNRDLSFLARSALAEFPQCSPHPDQTSPMTVGPEEYFEQRPSPSPTASPIPR